LFQYIAGSTICTDQVTATARIGSMIQALKLQQIIDRQSKWLKPFVPSGKGG
jgi:hypothetical protein